MALFEVMLRNKSVWRVTAYDAAYAVKRFDGHVIGVVRLEPLHV